MIMFFLYVFLGIGALIGFAIASFIITAILAAMIESDDQFIKFSGLMLALIAILFVLSNIGYIVTHIGQIGL